MPYEASCVADFQGEGAEEEGARPDEARDALAAIEATSRETLSGLRRMVTGLRRADLEPRLGQAPPGPAPRRYSWSGTPTLTWW